MEDEPAPLKESLVKKLLLKLGPYVLGVLFVTGVTIYAISQKPEILGLSKGPAQVQAEVEIIVTEVGKLISLPADETPTVATVTDVEKLKDQPFFANAQNDDKVLIYTNAKKAILYRPSEKRIIEVGAVNIKGDQNLEGASPEPTSTPEPTETPLP
jgi:hypothetical protein